MGEVVEAEPRFQATPDDFEKEHTINVKEDQFNMSEAAPEPMMENLVQEQQPELVVLEQEVVETKEVANEIPQDLVVPEEPKAEIVDVEPPKIQEEEVLLEEEKVPEAVEQIAKPVEETPELV